MKITIRKIIYPIIFAISLSIGIIIAFANRETFFVSSGHYKINNDLRYETFSTYKDFFKSDEILLNVETKLAANEIYHDNGAKILKDEILGYMYSQNKDSSYEVYLTIRIKEPKISSFICNYILEETKNFFQTYNTNFDYRNNLKAVFLAEDETIEKTNTLYYIVDSFVIGFSTVLVVGCVDYFFIYKGNKKDRLV